MRMRKGDARPGPPTEKGPAAGSTPKSLYRRLDLVLGELHARERGAAFLGLALGALYETFGEELALRGAQLFVHNGVLLEGLTQAGRAMPPGAPPIALTDLHGQRVHLLEGAGAFSNPIGFFEVALSQRPYLFLFVFEQHWQREAAELVLNTACSILSLKLLEESLGATLREAAEIQKSLLPPEPPAFPGFELAARSEPAEEVGGDWFDFLALGPPGEGALGIAIGDASGHGLPAALMARDVVIGLRMGLERELKAGFALAKLNRVIHGSSLSSCFASLWFGELEENGSLFYYNAGHDAPLLVRDGRCESLRSGSPVLGPLPEARFRRHFAHLDHGATLALYTDGLTERRSRSGELFGLERLSALLAEHEGLSAAELVARVFDEVERFGASGSGRDDATLVIVRRPAS